MPASELIYFDRRCVNRISTWRKIIDIRRKQGAMRLAQILVNGVGLRRGSGQRCFARLIWHWVNHWETNNYSTEIKWIHVQSYDKKTGRVLWNWFIFWFGWKTFFPINAYIPMAIANFQHDFITEGNGIRYVFRNGTDIF